MSSSDDRSFVVAQFGQLPRSNVHTKLVAKSAHKKELNVYKARRKEIIGEGERYSGARERGEDETGNNIFCILKRPIRELSRKQQQIYPVQFFHFLSPFLLHA